MIISIEQAKVKGVSIDELSKALKIDDQLLCLEEGLDLKKFKSYQKLYINYQDI